MYWVSRPALLWQRGFSPGSPHRWEARLYRKQAVLSAVWMLVQVLSVSLSERSVLWDPGHCGTSGISVLPASALLPLQRQFAPPWSTLFHQPALELVMLLYLLWSFCHLPMSFCVLAAVVAARSLSCCPSSQEEPRDSSWHDFTPQSLASLTHCPSDSPLPLHLLVFNAFVTIVFLYVACSALIQR